MGGSLSSQPWLLAGQGGGREAGGGREREGEGGKESEGGRGKKVGRGHFTLFSIVVVVDGCSLKLSADGKE